MEQYIIRGGNPLAGEVEISGAKNAALGILAAAIMTDDTVLIENLPDVRDINVLLEAMESIGVRVERITRHAVMMNSENIGEVSVDYDYIKRIRASYYLIVHCLANIKRRRCRFRADATSAAGRSTSTSKASVHSEPK